MALNSIGKTEKVDVGSPSRPESVYASVKGAEAAAATAPQVQAPKPAAPPRYSDVRVKFMVDAQTRDVTVLILDRASQKVIRTIPADEMANLNEGDILELFA
jgi:hypothetical protein